jgi:hypothetical protein
MLGMNVLALDFEILANNWLFAHGTGMLFRVMINETLAKTRSAKSVAFQIALVPVNTAKLKQSNKQTKHNVFQINTKNNTATHCMFFATSEVPHPVQIKCWG